jgi:hypothetical protein
MSGRKGQNAECHRSVNSETLRRMIEAIDAADADDDEREE